MSGNTTTNQLQGVLADSAGDRRLTSDAAAA